MVTNKSRKPVEVYVLLPNLKKLDREMFLFRFKRKDVETELKAWRKLGLKLRAIPVTIHLDRSF